MTLAFQSASPLQTSPHQQSLICTRVRAQRGRRLEQGPEPGFSLWLGYDVDCNNSTSDIIHTKKAKRSQTARSSVLGNGWTSAEDASNLHSDSHLNAHSRRDFLRHAMLSCTAICFPSAAMSLLLPGEANGYSCLLYTSPSPRDQRGSRMPSSA